MKGIMSLANGIVQVANTELTGINNADLQKAIYFLDTIHMLKYQESLFDKKNFHFEKGAYGPIMRPVYESFQDYGSNKITQPIPSRTDYGLNDDGSITKERVERYEEIDDDTYHFIQAYLPALLNYTSFQLVDKAQQEPQWKDTKSMLYDSDKSMRYYERSEHRFWERT